MALGEVTKACYMGFLGKLFVTEYRPFEKNVIARIPDYDNCGICKFINLYKYIKFDGITK